MSNQRSVFATRLIEARKAKGWSQRRLAEEMDIYQQNIAYWEMDRTKPSMDNLPKLVEALEVSVDWLLGVEGDRVRHGTWEPDPDAYVCSLCHRWLAVRVGTASMNYCPHCGAKMKKEAER